MAFSLTIWEILIKIYTHLLFAFSVLKLQESYKSTKPDLYKKVKIGLNKKVYKKNNNKGNF